MSDIDVTVVSMMNYSFEKAIEEKFYAYPKSNNKDIHDYVAVYRSEPVSAVTHICKVESVTQNEDISTTYKAICFGDRIDESAVIVRFDDIQELEKPITGDGRGVQGWMYTGLAKLQDAESIREL